MIPEQGAAKDKTEVKQSETLESQKEQKNDSPPDSPARARTIESFRKMEQAAEKRWNRLQNNKEWVWETYRIQVRLEPFVKSNLTGLKTFFRPTFVVTEESFRAVKSKIDKLKDAELEAVLERYANYVLRYGVVFTLQENQPHFRIRWVGFGLNKFHVKITDGQVEPIGGTPAWEAVPPPSLRGAKETMEELLVQTPVSDDLETDDLEVPNGIQQLVAEGTAKYVLIKDEDDFSVLRQISSFAFSPDQVTIVDYEFERVRVSASKRKALSDESADLERRRFLIVGENVPLNQVWPKLRKITATYQRKYAKHDQRGAASQGAQLRKYLSAIVQGGDSMQNIAANFVEDKESPGYQKRLATMQSHLSQLKRKLWE
jgi:hypothetical protein